MINIHTLYRLVVMLPLNTRKAAGNVKATSQLLLPVSDANTFLMSCTKTRVCLEMTPVPPQLRKQHAKETEDHGAKLPKIFSLYFHGDFKSTKKKKKRQITRNVGVRKGTQLLFDFFLSLTLTLPSQWGLPAWLPGHRVRGESAWNHFLKFLQTNRKKTPAVLVWMHGDKAQKPQQLPTLKAGFSVYTGKFSLQLTRLLIFLENWLNTIQVKKTAASAWKNGSKGPVHTKSLSISVDGAGITLSISRRPLSVHQKSHRRSPWTGKLHFQHIYIASS